MRVISLVGRPNVGKSSLFNRLCQSSAAIVHGEPGTTRDRKLGMAKWLEKEFIVIDTGGYSDSSDDSFQEHINLQVKTAIQQSDLVLFIVDGREGLTVADEEFASMLRKSKKSVVVVVNKVDTPDKSELAGQFYSLGFGHVFPISASSGYGTGDFLDELTTGWEAKKDEQSVGESPKIAIVGKTNVGKSTFLNTLTGEDRSVVSSVAGTTRDSVHTEFKGFGFQCTWIDTAGIRRPKHHGDDVEFYSHLRTINAIEECDVCILMIDSSEGMTHQDLWIFSLIVEQGKGVVICSNKWDLVEKDHKTAKEYEDRIKARLMPFSDVPVVFTSGINRSRLIKVLETAIEVAERRKRKISTSSLNDQILPVLKANRPPIFKGKAISVKYIQQAVSEKMIFLVYCNLPQYIKDPYKRFVENTIRSRFDLTGVPISIFYRKSS